MGKIIRFFSGKSCRRDPETLNVVSVTFDIGEIKELVDTSGRLVVHDGKVICPLPEQPGDQAILLTRDGRFLATAINA